MITTIISVVAGLYHSLHYRSLTPAKERLINAHVVTDASGPENDSEDEDEDHVQQHQNRLAFVVCEVFGCYCARLRSRDADAAGGGDDEGKGKENASGNTVTQRNVIISVIWGFLVPFCDRDFTWVFLTRLLMQVRAKEIYFIWLNGAFVHVRHPRLHVALYLDHGLVPRVLHPRRGRSLPMRARVRDSSAIMQVPIPSWMSAEMAVSMAMMCLLFVTIFSSLGGEATPPIISI